METTPSCLKAIEELRRRQAVPDVPRESQLAQQRKQSIVQVDEAKRAKVDCVLKKIERQCYYHGPKVFGLHPDRFVA